MEREIRDLINRRYVLLLSVVILERMTKWLEGWAGHE